MPVQMADNKYGNNVTEVDGYVFASKAEATRYSELKLLARAGVITDLTLHPVWDLTVNGMLVAKYIGDFVYTDVKTGTLTIEDVKGVRTPVYKLKKKLMLAIHGLTITEIDA
jgi:hypothetical protein